MPSDSEMLIFERHLENISGEKSDPKILIIGSSPALRNLTAKLRFRTVVVANDLEVIERTSKLMKISNEKEQWLEGDIIKLPLEKNSFDVIFGDYVVSNISPFNREDFYKRMSEILKREGFAVIRSVVFDKTEKPFERKISRHFKIMGKEFGKQGIFAGHFPIYFIKPK